MHVFYRNRKHTGQLPPVPIAALPQTLRMAADMTALQIVKWLYFGKDEGLVGNLLSFDTATAESQWHKLVKRPQCPACGDDHHKDRKPPAPIVPEKRSEFCFTTQGGYRDVPPEHTIDNYIHHVSPITGVVQWLKPYHPTREAPVFNYSSGLNVAMQSKNMFWMNYHVRGANGGKGKNLLQAKAGALCEAIERYSCTFQGDEYYITGSFEGLGSSAIHPNACMNFSEKQYRNREETNKDCRKFYLLVPRPFDKSLEMHWTSVYSLTHQESRYLPSSYCYAQYPEEDDLNRFAYPDSNGCAAGNSMEEAILQGFLELVERDSVALWWYNMLPKPGVDPAGFNDPYFLRMMEYYKSLGRGLYLLDLTSDLRIPVFGAISYRMNDKKQEILFGFGAHVDAKIAAERALVELNQLLPIALVPEADRKQGRYRTKDDGFAHWLHTATLENQPYLVPMDSTPLKKVNDYAPLCPAVVYDSLEYCIACAAEQGLETLVLDMTRPDVGLNVVKVIVPGMRHFWKRLAPGRLYDVPVKMEWLREPLKEEQLNPIGLFI